MNVDAEQILSEVEHMLLEDRVQRVVLTVAWLDSCQTTHGWQLLRDIKPTPITECYTVGFLLHIQPDFIGLVQNVSTVDDDGALQCMGYIKIPRRCIIRMARIDKSLK